MRGVTRPNRSGAGPLDFRAASQQRLRLNKFLSSAGVASRRKADELILAGSVSINGQIVTTLGAKVDPSKDKVFVSGKQVVTGSGHLYILLNKPKDCITTTRDEKGRRTVLDLVRVKERIYPVGRLDRNTTGALILTNDGELAHRLMHPRFEIKKAYEVELDRPLSSEALGKLRSGVRIEGERTSPADVFLRPRSNRKIVGVIIHEGRNRQVRKMFEACGYDVRKLHRVADGPLTVEGLSRGEWRFLTKREVASLRELVRLS
jgi:23S rRNA pseudouridine2605 synthase